MIYEGTDPNRFSIVRFYRNSTILSDELSVIGAAVILADQVHLLVRTRKTTPLHGTFIV